MATTNEELKSLQDVNADKRKKLLEQQRKSAELQRLIQNDQTKDALERESQQLDAQLAQADEQLKALEEASGVSANSIKLQATRSADASTEPVVPAPTMASAESTETASSPSSSKRGSK